MAFISALFYWLNHQPTKEGREKEYPEKTPGDELQKMPHTKARRFKPQARLEPEQQHWWQARKADMLTGTPRVAPAGGQLSEKGRHCSRTQAYCYSDQTSWTLRGSVYGKFRLPVLLFSIAATHDTFWRQGAPLSSSF